MKCNHDRKFIKETINKGVKQRVYKCRDRNCTYEAAKYYIQQPVLDTESDKVEWVFIEEVNNQE